MPIILTAGGGGRIILHNPDAGAEVGRWCKAPQVPDLCHTCFDPRTLAHYSATGYIEDTDGWRQGTCRRCNPHPEKAMQGVRDYLMGQDG